MYVYSQGHHCLWSVWDRPFKPLRSVTSQPSIPLYNVPMFITGETGLGKSTLIDTLFNTNLREKKSSHFRPNVELKIQTYQLQESNVQLKLTVVTTVGYGDQMNKEAR